MIILGALAVAVRGGVSTLPSQVAMLTLYEKAAPLLFALTHVHASYWAMMFPMMLLSPGPVRIVFQSMIVSIDAKSNVLTPDRKQDLAFAVFSVQISKSVDESLQSLAGALFNVMTR
jgi:hypothetical protein